VGVLCLRSFESGITRLSCVVAGRGPFLVVGECLSCRGAYDVVELVGCESGVRGLARQPGEGLRWVSKQGGVECNVGQGAVADKVSCHAQQRGGVIRSRFG
jgi:hypothetical protein